MVRKVINEFDEEHLNEAILRLHIGIMKMNFREIWLSAYAIKDHASYRLAYSLKGIAAELQRKGAAKEIMSSVLNDYIELLNRNCWFPRQVYYSEYCWLWWIWNPSQRNFSRRFQNVERRLIVHKAVLISNMPPKIAKKWNSRNFSHIIHYQLFFICIVFFIFSLKKYRV